MWRRKNSTFFRQISLIHALLDLFFSFTPSTDYQPLCVKPPVHSQIFISVIICMVLCKKIITLMYCQNVDKRFSSKQFFFFDAGQKLFYFPRGNFCLCPYLPLWVELLCQLKSLLMFPCLPSWRITVVYHRAHGHISSCKMCSPWRTRPIQKNG